MTHLGGPTHATLRAAGQESPGFVLTNAETDPPVARTMYNSALVRNDYEERESSRPLPLIAIAFAPSENPKTRLDPDPDRPTYAAIYGTS